MKGELQTTKPLIPAGEQLLKLVSTDPITFPDRAPGAQPGAMVSKWIWRFISNYKDPDGAPYELDIFTFKKYGGSKAALTRLLDNIEPGMNDLKFIDYDTEHSAGKVFEANIKHETSPKTGKVYADYVWMRPHRNVARLAVAPVVVPPAAGPPPRQWSEPPPQTTPGHATEDPGAFGDAELDDPFGPAGDGDDPFND